SGENTNDARPSAAVPEFGSLRTPRATELSEGMSDDGIVSRASHHIGALCQRDRSFRVVSQGHAGHSEHCGLFLDAARIGQDQGSVRHHAEEIQIPQRFHAKESSPFPIELVLVPQRVTLSAEAEFVDPSDRSRMRWKED